ncbi:MAG TPA: DNA polymerase III subunit delta, partial [Clostridia bacterium]|nr:DNA polymerase III subunit delta [Clostridia bacterium]
IISLMARQFRLILAVAQAGGEKRLKLHPYVARKIKRQSKNFSNKTAEFALRRLLEIDVAIKSGKQDFYPAVETMIMKIALSTKKQ